MRTADGTDTSPDWADVAVLLPPLALAHHDPLGAYVSPKFRTRHIYSGESDSDGDENIIVVNLYGFFSLFLSFGV